MKGRNVIVMSLAMLVAAAVHAQHIEITTGASRPSVSGAAQNFTGTVFVDPLFAATDHTRATGGQVTFTPGARTAWHSHPAGQVLIVTSGLAWVQEWNGEKREITPGDVIWTPPGVKHWHGATATTGMTHIAIQENVGGKNVEWREPVSDEQYGKAGRAAATSPSGAQPATLTSDDVRSVAPALERYRREVLVGDLWKRPGLSPRDRVWRRTSVRWRLDSCSTRVTCCSTTCGFVRH